MRNSIAGINYSGASRSPFVRVVQSALFMSATALTLLAQTDTSANADKTSDPNAASDKVYELPALEVRATLRSAPMMAIPIAVAVVSGDQMVQLNLKGMSDVTPSIPSLTFRAGASNKDTSLLIRGVGTITTSPGTEPDVSTVVDGVVLARPGQSTMDLVDVDHIEILRGPQGTLFGKNSSVGVVNVVTKELTDRKQGFYDLAYSGGGNEEVVRAGMSGAIIPNQLKAAVSLLYNNYDGNVQNVFLNRTVNGHRNFGGRAKFVYSTNPNFKATFIVSFINSFFTTPNDGPVLAASTTAFPSGITTPNATVAAAIVPVVPSSNNLTINSGIWGRTYDHNGGASAQLEWVLGEHRVTSITAYQHWYNNQFQDTGIIPQSMPGSLTLSWDKGYVWFDQYSQELRLTSPTGKFFDYVAGLYFQRAIDTETYHRDIVQQPTAGNFQANFGEAHYGTHGDNYSAYGEGIWHITPAFRLVTGLRLTDDKLNFYHGRIASASVAKPGIQPTLPVHSGSTSSTGVSGRASLQYDLSKNDMLYATFSKGYKGPAYNVFFNQTALQTAALLPETSDSYEVGLKGAGLHNRLQYTVTYFDTIYHNYQANFQTLVVGTPVTNLINAGQVSSKGVEADMRARLTEHLSMGASISSITAVVDHFNTPAGATNIDGQPLPFAPKLKSNVEATYRIPAADKMFFEWSSNYTYQDKVQFSLTQTPDTIQAAYGIWNMSFALSKPSAGWRVSLLVKNIMDKHYASYLAQGSGFDWRIVPRDNSRYFGIVFHKDLF